MSIITRGARSFIEAFCLIVTAARARHHRAAARDVGGLAAVRRCGWLYRRGARILKRSMSIVEFCKRQLAMTRFAKPKKHLRRRCFGAPCALLLTATVGSALAEDNKPAPACRAGHPPLPRAGRSAAISSRHQAGFPASNESLVDVDRRFSSKAKDTRAPPMSSTKNSDDAAKASTDAVKGAATATQMQ